MRPVNEAHTNVLMFRHCFFTVGAVRVLGVVRLWVRGVALMNIRHPNNQHVGRAPLKKRVFVRTTLNQSLVLDEIKCLRGT